MRLSVVFFVLIFATVALAQAPAGAQKPLGKNQIIDLVKAGMDSEELAKTVQERGIDFDLSDDYLEALRKAGAQDVLIKALRALKPRPLTKEQVLQLVVGGVASQRAAVLVKQRGIDFMPDEEYLGTVRVAGAEEGLLAALRTAGAAATAEIVVVTSPNAEVYLDGELKGRANAQSELAMKARLGAHALKVTLARKKDFEQSVTLAGGQATKIEARLEDLPGRILIHSSVGAEVFLDSASRGRTDARGQLTIDDVAPGSHELRVSAHGRKDFRESVTVRAGQEASLEAQLAEAEKAPAIIGDWEGVLDFRKAGMQAKLRVVLHVTEAKDGSLTATFASPDQNASGIPVTTITYKEPSLHFETVPIHGSYDGTMNKEKSEITGEWKQSGLTLPLVFQRVH